MTVDAMASVRATSVIGVVAGIGLVLFLFGAVPFVAVPTLGQAIWTTGFSQSFANQSLLAIHAIHSGAPEPAAIAFGLSGAYPASLFIRWGLRPADAYALMFAGWLAVAYLGAWRLARRWQASTSVASLCAILWLGSPMIIGHADYSMLALGLALMPLYVGASLGVLEAAGERRKVGAVALFWACCVIAVFMDGYSFVMFAVGTAILWAWQTATLPDTRKALLRFAMPAYALGFGMAYLLYTRYVGRVEGVHSGVEFFRAWGVDLEFLVTAPWGIIWLFDLLGWSVKRTVADEFGDASVWITTFCLPLLTLSLYAFAKSAPRRRLATGFLLVAVVGFYFSLGPSLKIGTSRPPGMADYEGMPQAYASFPTGSAWISEHVPGFSSMRASYRWSALGMLGLWAICVLWASQPSTRKARAIAALLAVCALSAPNWGMNWVSQVGMRSMFLEIDDRLLADLRTQLVQGERVAFLPYSNDFLASYLAAATQVHAYNIGGDKNLVWAKKAWPQRLRELPPLAITPNLHFVIAKLLFDGEADAVVIPFFDSLWAAHYFPCVRDAHATMSERARAAAEDLDLECPTESAQRMAPTIASLKAAPELVVHKSELFATIRLHGTYTGGRNVLLASYLQAVPFPIRTVAQNANSERVLWQGWWELAPHYVWSSGTAQLRVPVPPLCRAKACNLTLRVSAFAATPERPLGVQFLRADHPVASLSATEAGVRAVVIPVDGSQAVQNIRIDVPQARSPAELGMSADTRRLGIALFSIDLEVLD